MALTQEEILMKFVQGEAGRAWANSLYGWNLDENSSSLPLCDWQGVVCIPAGGKAVTAIELEETNLIATIPPEFGLLNSLRVLVLRRNGIHGTIPDSVAKLRNLEIMDLSNNKLSGFLPVFTSEKLREVILGYNALSGGIPKDFGVGHASMIELNLARNQLSGTLPESLGGMTNINKISFSENKFYGFIPESIGKFKSLEFLFLDENVFVGTIPKALSPPDSKLKEIYLQGNILSGTVPETFSKSADLVKLHLNGNKLTGTVPGKLCRPEINKNFFDDSNNAGERNYCSTIACPANTVSLDGLWPCSSCPANFYSPYLGREGICLPLNNEAILRIFWIATNGIEWSGEWNWFFDGVDLCDFTGIACNDSKEIVSIVLSNFNLRGTIPEEIGFLMYLEVLDLSDNFLLGHIPSDLRFASLNKLDLSGNQLTGLIPPMLCRVDDLNGNGKNGEFSCDKIACPSGSYSSTGRAVDKANICLPCYDNIQFLGRKMCFTTTMDERKERMSSFRTVSIITLFLFALITPVVAFLFLRYRNEFSKRNKKSQSTSYFVETKMPPPSDPLYAGTFPESSGMEIEQVDMCGKIISNSKSKKKKNKVKTPKRKKHSSKTSKPLEAEQVALNDNENDADSEWSGRQDSTKEVWLDVPRIN